MGLELGYHRIPIRCHVVVDTMKKEKPQSFEDFVGSEGGKKIVDRVLREKHEKI